MAPLAAAAPFLWSVAGLGVGLLGSYMMGKNQQSQYESMMSQMQAQSVNADAVGSMPTVPTNPVTTDPTDPNAGQNQEAEDAARAMEEAARQAQQQYNPSGGLGLTSNAPGKRPTLSGA